MVRGRHISGLQHAIAHAHERKEEKGRVATGQAAR